MKKLSYALITALLLMFTGCANKGPEYEAGSYSQIKQISYGEVIENRDVVIKDGGGGKFLGAIVGGVLGSTMGAGDGKTLMVLGGALAGGYAGNEAGKANAEELTVRLENGEIVVVVTKGEVFGVGDRVKIIKDGNKVASVENLSKKGVGNQ